MRRNVQERPRNRGLRSIQANGRSSVETHRGARCRVPAAGLADLAGEWATERFGDEAGRDEHAVQRRAVLPAGRIEEVDEVFSREIAGGARRVRAATRPTGRCVEAANPGFEPGDD